MSSIFLLFALDGCAPTEAVLEGAGPGGEVNGKIYGGEAPDQPWHDAVVGIHERTKRGVYSLPFCSGTLIDEEWVMTAAHCAVRGGTKARSASTVAIYVGDDPSTDLLSHLYSVDSVTVHSSYSSRTLRNDIALLHLSTPITEVDPVPYLPATEALSAADIGELFNHAGFGYDENRDYGVKLQVDLALAGFGCVVTGCPSSGDAATQISYSQAGALGPCNGDSGGPMFVTRASGTYVGGITSYGDAACEVYGVSTRVDGFADWIASRTGI